MTFISELHTLLRSRRGISDDRYPDVPRKEYPRFEHIALPSPRLEMTLSEALATRTSSLNTRVHETFSAEMLGSLLAHALKSRSTYKEHRPYPSGGGLFPIEVYVYVERVSELAKGLYHYAPHSHTLARLWDFPEKNKQYITQESVGDVSLFLIFTARWAQSAKKYGDFAYMLSLLEAGHMAQNVLLVAAALKNPARPLAGFNDEHVGKLLDLDESEQALYVIAL